MFNCKIGISLTQNIHENFTAKMQIIPLKVKMQIILTET